jgi:CcmD family protein
VIMKTLRAFLVALVLAGTPGIATAQPPAPEGFVPVDQLPNQEEMPAMPLVAAAYGVAWAAVLIYLFSIWRRLNAVEREMADVARRIEAGGRR